jgi:hypothetical protein
MKPDFPLRLLHRTNDKFEVLDCRASAQNLDYFDILTYTWGPKVVPYNPSECGIEGVTWKVKVNPEKIEGIKRLMDNINLEYLWVDCVCLNQEDGKEMSVETAKMYQYYKSARKCYILMEMEEEWYPQEIVDNLKFIDHVLAYMRGAALASEAKLTENLTNRLSMWANAEWKFPLDISVVKSAAIDLGVINCYWTNVNRVITLFDNAYFTRVWTFQEMLLGKNITMYGVNKQRIFCLGELDTWMDLATDSNDKASKLDKWIKNSRVLTTASVNAVLGVLEEDCLILQYLQIQVQGISSARTDIISGGSNWWHENYKGINNVFSAISMRPRECEYSKDIFRGLLGVFSGLFTPEEIEKDINGDNVEKISFAFFKQLSIKTGYAWTKLAISGGERGEWEWIPMVPKNSQLLTTDCFAAVVRLGRLPKQLGLARATAMTGITGSPRKYMKIVLKEDNRGFQFTFQGCNCGKKVKSGFFSHEPIPVDTQVKNVTGDETGRILVQCATILGSIMDPAHDVVEYRERLLNKLQPFWHTTDRSAKPLGWVERCVSGTFWEKPGHDRFKVHNRSMNYKMGEITHCESRMYNESTVNISCEVSVNCGCKIVGPFALIFAAITAVEGSSLGEASARLEKDRVIMKDGMGLVQVGDVGRAFKLVAFGGDVEAYKNYATRCRNTKFDKPVLSNLPWPKGRALVREEFTHGFTDSMRDYGYVDSEGSGNLLICRNNPIGDYKIVGVCIDEEIENKKGEHVVTLQ